MTESNVIALLAPIGGGGGRTRRRRRRRTRIGKQSGKNARSVAIERVVGWEEWSGASIQTHTHSYRGYQCARRWARRNGSGGGGDVGRRRRWQTSGPDKGRRRRRRRRRILVVCVLVRAQPSSRQNPKLFTASYYYYYYFIDQAPTHPSSHVFTHTNVTHTDVILLCFLFCSGKVRFLNKYNISRHVSY